MNGWWRILIIVMALIMGVGALSAFTGRDNIGTVDLAYDPPTPPGDNAFARAIADCPACAAYDRKWRAEADRLGLKLAADHGCMANSVSMQDVDNQRQVTCRPWDHAFSILAGAALACGLLALFGAAVGWVAAGFRGGHREAA